MAAPVISPLPSAPAASDAVADFEAKALEFVDALQPFGSQANALAAWVEDTAEDVDAAKTSAQSAAATAAADAAAAASAVMDGVYAARDAAQGSASAASGSASSAAGSATLAGQHKDAAEVAAAAAGAAAGLPALAGNNGRPLRVRANGTGVEFAWGPIGALKSAPAEVGLPIAAVSGDVIDIRAANRVINLPASPANMDAVTVYGNGHSPVVDPGAKSINGVSDTVIVDINRCYTFIFMSGLNTWRVR